MARKTFLLTLLSLLLFSTCLAETPRRPAHDVRFFWGTLTGAFDSTDETIIGCINVEEVTMMSVTASIATTDDVTLTGDLKVLGSETKISSIADGYHIDSHASLQSWTTTGAQSVIWVEDVKPTWFCSFTSTCSTGATTPGTVTLTVRGFRRGEGGEQTW